MSDTEQRFGLTMGGVDRDEPGLIRERDGTVWLVNPDGTRTQLPGNGGSQPEVTDGLTTIAAASSLHFPAGSVTDLGGGQAGIAVQLLLIGPFPFAYNSPNIANQFKLADLDPGTILLRAWAIVDVAFDADPASDLQIGVGGPDWDDPDDDWGTVWVGAANSGAAGGNGYELEGSGDGATQRVARINGPDPGALVVGNFNGPNGTQGSGNVYAVIAVPL